MQIWIGGLAQEIRMGNSRKRQQM